MGIKGEIDTRPFLDRIIPRLSFRRVQAFEMAEGKRQCVGDIGSLMQVQAFNIATARYGGFVANNVDIKCLNTWSDHYKACRCPFLVVRESNRQIAIYKRREAVDPKQTQWLNRKERLEN